MESLENYTRAVLAIEKFKENNKKIFDELEMIEKAKEFCEKELRDECIEKSKDIENAFFRVTVSERWKKWYDYSLLDKKQKKEFLEKGIADISVDKLEFEKAVKDGAIDRELKQKLYREELQSKYVTIKSLCKKETN